MSDTPCLDILVEALDAFEEIITLNMPVMATISKPWFSNLIITTVSLRIEILEEKIIEFQSQKLIEFQSQKLIGYTPSLPAPEINP